MEEPDIPKTKVKKSKVAKTKLRPRITPVNYDFGKNWNSKIVPILDTTRAKRALTTAMNQYLSDLPGKKRYKPGTCSIESFERKWRINTDSWIKSSTTS